MTAKELMIGDWVMVYPWDETPWEPKKITDINFHSWEGTDFCDSVGVEGWDELSLDEIKPIPLTPEILEKNLFVQDGESWWYKDFRIVLSTSKGVSLVCGRQVKFYYVHELQHAMHLCEIEKEIIL